MVIEMRMQIVVTVLSVLAGMFSMFFMGRASAESDLYQMVHARCVWGQK